MEKEEYLLKKRLLELAELCFQRDVPAHSDFLNLNEQTIFYSIIRELPPVPYILAGGFELAERKIVCFLPSYMDESSFEPPVSCIRFTPLNARFAEDLTHRDYLGSVMNLGIDRCKTGDILLNDNETYLFCLEDMAPYIAGEMTRVRHTSVKTEICRPGEISYTPRFEEIEGSVASVRLDSVLALAFRCSRSKILPYIQGERVFINGKMAVSNSASLKEGDIVSVRGLGRFRYTGVRSETKKGRMFISVQKYC
ncbi:MAG TPA: RNA-binding protein [Candidatus Lachnoclostridium stercoravium]|uniref:RNA-binding protein n=1 Tax=Candidatus Lachnoclostridium stercoravium TaxID=2838633 RepID=A0A9D2HGZ5_9FIRM|nr:RNA-binding protein [Candidatus Lachnoclostridium stercoravium]